jgi:hypothetical protein
VAQERLDRPAQHRLAAELPVLLGSAPPRRSPLPAATIRAVTVIGARLAPARRSCKGAPSMQMLKPIKIGPVEVASPVILAPMTAVTDLPFRRIVKRYGCGLTVSEMIASQAMVRETRQSLQKSLSDPAEEPVSMQLGRLRAARHGRGAKLNEQRGARSSTSTWAAR